MNKEKLLQKILYNERCKKERILQNQINIEKNALLEYSFKENSEQNKKIKEKSSITSSNTQLVNWEKRILKIKEKEITKNMKIKEKYDQEMNRMIDEKEQIEQQLKDVKRRLDAALQSKESILKSNEDLLKKISKMIQEKCEENQKYSKIKKQFKKVSHEYKRLKAELPILRQKAGCSLVETAF